MSGDKERKRAVSFNVRIRNFVTESDSIEVYHVYKNYHEVFVNDEEFSDKKDEEEPVNDCRYTLSKVIDG